MNKAISPGELAAGQFVTILEHKYEVDYTPTFSGEPNSVTVTKIDRSGCGDVLIVLAVDLPYVAVKYKKPYPTKPVSLDTRRVTLMELSPEYVKVFMDSH